MRAATGELRVFQFVVNVPAVVFQGELNAVDREVSIDAHGIGLGQ